jgi:hypothetical protein
LASRFGLLLVERRIAVYDGLMTLAATAPQNGDVLETVMLGLQKYRIDQIKNSGVEQNSQVEAEAEIFENPKNRYFWTDSTATAL